MNKFTLRAKIYAIFSIVIAIPVILIDCEESLTICNIRPFLLFISIVLLFLTYVILLGKKKE
ncbi:hypothetical protein [uncultured Tenacibaculum sp.]|uniref:hypothetical protein n=1 Tax=uncultured Tenacibaculum sp. TaxID=174713 RepID=UPI00105028E8|nr:hypothetical protein [uncultured Tenacibaculum sp.]TCI90679.1 hypothetical protein EYW44_13230 [Tenacibaculum sp. M341]